MYDLELKYKIHSITHLYAMYSKNIMDDDSGFYGTRSGASSITESCK